MESYRILLGFDFGMKNIGVAVGQSITKSATPLKKIPAKNGIPSFKVIEEIIQEWGVNLIIIGYPINMDGSEQKITHAAKKMGEKLYQKFKIPIVFVDERLSTYEAKKYKKSPGINGHSLSAKVVVESWFKERYQDNFPLS